MSPFSRRGFLAASAATAASLMLPARVRAQSGRMSLTAATRTIDVRGKAATVWGLLDGAGRSGLVLDPDQAFAVDLTNALAEPTIIHWHGQIPDNAQVLLLSAQLYAARGQKAAALELAETLAGREGELPKEQQLQLQELIKKTR